VIPFLVLLGINILLLPLPIRHVASHTVVHVIEHILQHHEEGFTRAANVTLWGLVLAIPLALLLRLWWVAGDAALISRRRPSAASSTPSPTLPSSRRTPRPWVNSRCDRPRTSRCATPRE
jgi:hypothetical protein